MCSYGFGRDISFKHSESYICSISHFNVTLTLFVRHLKLQNRTDVKDDWCGHSSSHKSTHCVGHLHTRRGIRLARVGINFSASFSFSTTGPAHQI